MWRSVVHVTPDAKKDFHDAKMRAFNVVLEAVAVVAMVSIFLLPGPKATRHQTWLFGGFLNWNENDNITILLVD